MLAPFFHPTLKRNHPLRGRRYASKVTARYARYCGKLRVPQLTLSATLL